MVGPQSTVTDGIKVDFSLSISLYNYAKLVATRGLDGKLIIKLLHSVFKKAFEPIRRTPFS